MIAGPIPQNLWEDPWTIPQSEVDLFRFIAYGEFGPVKLGDRMGWIAHNFPPPDCVDPMPGGRSIWEYGDVEFHFAGDLLRAICCDDVVKVSAGKNIVLKKWFFDKPVRQSLRKVLTILVHHKIDFAVIHDPDLESVRVRVLKSRVNLHFQMTDPKRIYADADDVMFSLVGFGLVHEPEDVLSTS